MMNARRQFDSRFIPDLVQTSASEAAKPVDENSRALPSPVHDMHSHIADRLTDPSDGHAVGTLSLRRRAAIILAFATATWAAAFLAVGGTISLFR